MLKIIVEDITGLEDLGGLGIGCLGSGGRLVNGAVGGEVD